MSDEKPRVKIVENKVMIKGAPAYMVSFGDMMTLILCFFILLVALSSEREYGLMAKGLGSFVAAVKSHGLNGVMSAKDRQQVFDEVRRRFNLPPEPDPERRADHEQATTSEMFRSELVESLRPRRELHQPSLARFTPDSAALDDAARRYVSAQADSIRPERGQVLVLEGHAPPTSADRELLGFERARAVKSFLVNEHGFDPERVETRTWWVELDTERRFTDCVNARLVFPPERED